MVDWAKPIELIDGTPVVVSDLEPQPDPDGHYRVEREDGFFFEQEEEWACGNSRIFIAPNGRWWLDEDDEGVEPIVRNRELAA